MFFSMNAIFFQRKKMAKEKKNTDKINKMTAGLSTIYTKS